MAKKLTSWKTKGMNRDLSVSAFNPEFSFENRNLRLCTNDGNTLLSWVNEKSTKPLAVTGVTISGTPIGTAILNNYLVLFTTGSTGGNPDKIYRLEYALDKESLVGFLLFEGSLDFDVSRPLETRVSYESEDIQKVYWTDGNKQPRLINIAVTTSYNSGNSTQFDFVPSLKLKEDIKVKKILGGGGIFAPGVIQYAFTYYMKYGQESNIFYTTPLCYISHYDRGAAPDEKVDNIFEITVTDVDTDFDYLRIYSIQRTSIDGTPIVKRIQDIYTKDLEVVDSKAIVTYVDTGASGDSVDPMELLYKGGEEIAVETMEQKDGTLFFGGIKVTRPLLIDYKDRIQAAVDTVACNEFRVIKPHVVTTENYVYSNQLSSLDEDELETVPCGGFKSGETYRLGIQLQHKSGKWSEPIPISETVTGGIVGCDQTIAGKPGYNVSDNEISLPIFKSALLNNNGLFEDLWENGYRKVRPVVVFPTMQDRNIICQGVGCPAVATPKGLNNNFIGQSSWFFRTHNDVSIDSDGTAVPVGTPLTHLPYHGYTVIQGQGSDYGLGATTRSKFRGIEVEGIFDYDDEFLVCNKTLTLHSPEVELGEQVATLDLSTVNCDYVGYVGITSAFSDINIQTETPTISSKGSGFVHKAFSKAGGYGIVAGLFYDDFIADDTDDGDRIFRYDQQKASAKWLVYPWESSRALNNDINRPSDKGVSSAILKKKVISNLKFGYATWDTKETLEDVSAQLFNSDQNTIIKFGNKMYRGNIDTILTPSNANGNFFAWSGKTYNSASIPPEFVFTTDPTDFTSDDWCCTYSDDPDAQLNERIYGVYNNTIMEITNNIGDDYVELVMKKGGVRMKYKSSPHIVLHNDSADGQPTPFIFRKDGNLNPDGHLSIYELTKTVTNRFGGGSNDAFRENVWIPCGKAKFIDPTSLGVGIEWEYGDTYYQRYDCLKTYAYTPEDINQVVEIGSFMLETHINIDGRYDRNRGQLSNLNMSPQNFNLMNPVYSQIDNFFSYKITTLEKESTVYPNQITWSKTKESGADVDLWTNVTLASIMELDGDKGEIRKLIRFNNQLLAFQDTGIAHILYNDNVQISATNGVPIEIANSGKVNGKDYKSDTVGCSNKWSMTATPNGIYFMDSIGKNIFLFNGQLLNISSQGGFNAWSKTNISTSDSKWCPIDFDSCYVSYYDKLNREILFIGTYECLTFSEIVNAFTSFYSYENTPFFCNLDDTGIWIKADGSIWQHQEGGGYCNFFGVNKSYGMVLIGNPEPQTDKIFTNLEFRACVEGEGSTTGNIHVPFLPFDYLETWNEYQHGKAYLSIRNGHAAFLHHTLDDNASLKRKFRMWRCDIPRDNVGSIIDQVDVFDGTYDETFHPEEVQRIAHPVDRMRNPWLYLRLMKNAAGEGEVLPKAEIHDLVMTYYG